MDIVIIFGLIVQNLLQSDHLEQKKDSRGCETYTYFAPVWFRNMYCVWRAYLEGTVQVTQSRISACDNYKVQVADPAKTVRLQKEQQLRKVMQADHAHCSGFCRLCRTTLPPQRV